MQPEDIFQESRALREAIARFRTRREWYTQPDGRELAARASRLLAMVRRLAPEHEPEPSSRDWLHVVQWNILHGARFEAILHALRDERALAGADLISLNEADWGLARSGNRDVAFDLARELQMHAAWTPLYLELEGGYETPIEVATLEQRESFLGLALLSRFPLGRAHRVELPSPVDLLFDYERKVGSFISLVVEVLHPSATFHAVVTHLDVHGTPRDRVAQIETTLTALPAGPALLAGDFNSTTFWRGSWLRALRAFSVLALAPPSSLRQRLLRPHEPRGGACEPLFDVLRGAGFACEGFNDFKPSLDLILDDVHEVQKLPTSLRQAARPLLQHVERRSHHRLDWIVARGFVPAQELEATSVPHLMRAPRRVSDHAPIACGMRLMDLARH